MTGGDQAPLWPARTLFASGFWHARNCSSPWLNCEEVAMLDSDELARIMIEISAGWKWGDPRSEVLQTPEHELRWRIIARQMKEIADDGGIVDIPSGFPEPTGHGEKWTQSPRDVDNAVRPEPKKPIFGPSGHHAKSKTPTNVPTSEPGQIEYTYLAKKNGGEILALYKIEEGPEILRDRVLHASGWEPTFAIDDWRFGEQSDIDEISPETAKKTAEKWGLGQFVTE